MPQPISNLEEYLLIENKVKKKLRLLPAEELNELFADEDFDFDKHKQDLIEDIVSSIETEEIMNKLEPEGQSRFNWNFFWSCFYFSFSTFTTIGIGDWYPSGKMNKATVMIEGALGWLCLGLFITTYAYVLLR